MKALVGIGCTPGHEHDCQAAINPECTCACMGRNHQILISHPLAQIITPKADLITVCDYCGRDVGYNPCLNRWQHKDNPWADVSHTPVVHRRDGTI